MCVREMGGGEKRRERLGIVKFKYKCKMGYNSFIFFG